MRKEYIISSLVKYIKFEVDEDVVKCGEKNFEYLLKYIGENIDKGRDNYVGNAYVAIREKTNKILGVENWKTSKLRISKNEVKSIRQCFKKIGLKHGKYLMKIPFKVSYIFEAIILLVNEISQEKPIPQNLISLVGLSYGVAFYKKYINEYYVHFDEIKMDVTENPSSATLRCRLELNNDFTSVSSPFRVTFKG